MLANTLSSNMFLLWQRTIKGPSDDNVGVVRGIVFQETRPEDGVHPCDFLRLHNYKPFWGANGLDLV